MRVLERLSYMLKMHSMLDFGDLQRVIQFSFPST